MEDGLEILRQAGFALLIGALIGLEREYHHRLKGRTGFAGLRTFMFFTLMGALSARLSEDVHFIVFPVALLGLSLLLAARHYRLASGEDLDAGMTTEVAALLSFLLGAVVAVGRTDVAVALGVAVAVLLSAKPILSNWVERLTPQDIYTTLKFAVVTFVVLPFLPNQGFGPYEAFNPHEIWLMVVLISGVSFLGYVALKLLGPERGIAMSGILGGLASSTAVAVSFSRRSRETPPTSRAAAVAIVLASLIMVVRIAVEVAVVNASLLFFLWFPLLLVAVVGGVIGFFLWRSVTRRAGPAEELPVRNPFRLGAVLVFGGAYALVLFLVKAGQALLPAGSTAAVAVLSGLTQVDAITLSVSRLSQQGLDYRTAVTAILLAALSNTVAKAVIGVALGDSLIRRPLLLGLGGMFAAGLVGLALLGLF